MLGKRSHCEKEVQLKRFEERIIEINKKRKNEIQMDKLDLDRAEIDNQNKKLNSHLTKVINQVRYYSKALLKYRV